MNARKWSSLNANPLKITGKEAIMKLKDTTTIVRLVLVAGLVALILSLSGGTASVSAAAQNGQIHVTKECSQNTGLPGGFCTITSSNLAQIPVGSQIFYDQALGTPTGMLDSNVILDAGNSNRAVGRCTLELATGSGICTFSDGTGDFIGFEARVNVSFLPGQPLAPSFRWAGTYSYRPQPPR
jgi:hypothetical protein